MLKVTINGRELPERMTELEQRENHYFEIVKTASLFIVGVIVLMCLPGVLHLYSLLPAGLGQTIVHAYQSLP